MTPDLEMLKASLVLYGSNAIYAVGLLIIGCYLAGASQRFVVAILSVTHRVDVLVTAFLASIVRYAVLVVVGIAVLELFGIQTMSLVAVLGATSLAIGLALLRTLSNLAAGVMLLLFRPFRIGDEIEAASKAGHFLCSWRSWSRQTMLKYFFPMAWSGARRLLITAPIPGPAR
jgi:small conductance mechanosensitive channel